MLCGGVLSCEKSDLNDLANECFSIHATILLPWWWARAAAHTCSSRSNGLHPSTRPVPFPVLRPTKPAGQGTALVLKGPWCLWEVGVWLGGGCQLPASHTLVPSCSSRPAWWEVTPATTPVQAQSQRWREWLLSRVGWGSLWLPRSQPWCHPKPHLLRSRQPRE